VNELRVSLVCQTYARRCSVSLCVCLSVLVWPPFIPVASIRGVRNAVASSKKALDALRGGRASPAGIAKSKL
jgi:hypothetical protein